MGADVGAADARVKRSATALETLRKTILEGAERNSGWYWVEDV
jgi:hypothetical protein